jgi:LuxR family quorum sensing-dependent transcriptional regulator
MELCVTYSHDHIPAPRERLTSREIEIMTWTARGKTQWEVAALLSISEETVKRHIRNARRKLGATNKTHAIALALRHGFIVL